MHAFIYLLAEEDVLVKKKKVVKPAGMHIQSRSCGPSGQLNPGFCSMKHLLWKIPPTPLECLEWMQVQPKGTPSSNVPVSINLYTWMKSEKVEQSFLSMKTLQWGGFLSERH